MTTFYQFFKTISKFLLVLSKITMIILSIYYLTHYADYSVTINVPLILRSFTIINLPLKLIESLSMFIIIVPLTIIIMSFYYPENTRLKMLAGFCAIGGNLFTIAHLASKGLLEESFKTLFFTVYNVPSLDTKQKLFIDFFNQRINIYSKNVANVEDFKDFIQQQFDTNFVVYVNMLKTLSQLDVMSYASRLADQFHNDYVQSLMPIEPQTNLINKSETSKSKIWLYLRNGGLLLLAGFLTYKTYQNAVLLKDVAAEVWDLGRRVTKTLRGISQTDTLVGDVNNNVQNLTQQVISCGTRVTQVETSHAALSLAVSTNATVLNKLINRVAIMNNSVNTLAEDVILDTNPRGSNLPAMLQTLHNQIISLAQGGLTTNNNVTRLSSVVANINDHLNKIDNELRELTKQRVTATANSLLNDKSQLAAQAADMRWIEEARSKIRDFDALTTLKEVRSMINQQMKPLAEGLAIQVQDHIATSKSSIKDNKAVLTKKIEDVSTDLAGVKQVLNEKTKVETLQATSIQEIDARLQTVERTTDKLNTDLTKVTTDLQSIKNDYATLHNSVNNHILEMQTMISKYTVEIKKAFDDYKQYFTSTTRLAQNIRTDTANINTGVFTPRPFISKNPAVTNLIARRASSTEKPPQ